MFACPSTATQAPLATRETPKILIIKLQTAATTKENARRRSFTPMLSSLDDAQPSTVMRVMRAQREVSLSLALSLKTQTMFSSRASVIYIYIIYNIIFKYDWELRSLNLKNQSYLAPAVF